MADLELDIEKIIAAARQHGEDSEPDHEVGDLQQALDAMVAAMAPKELNAFQNRQSVKTAIGPDAPTEDFSTQLKDAVLAKSRTVGSAKVEVQALQWLLREGWESMSWETRRDFVTDETVVDNHADWAPAQAATPGV